MSRKTLVRKHPSWKLYDSSKLEEDNICPRKFFFRYRLGWRKDLPELNLIFGAALHAGMEQLYRASEKTGKYETGYDAAIAAFIQVYSEGYPDEASWCENSPKNLDGAAMCFSEYPDFYREDKFKLIGSEIFGSVPISDTRQLGGRLDLIILTDEGLLIVDNKTSGYSLNQTAIDEFEMRLQFFTYNLIGLSYALSLGYKPEDFHGVLVNHLAFKESKKDGLRVEFARHVVLKTISQLEQFTYEMLAKIEMIEWNDALLRSSSESVENPTMLAFPRCLSSCIQYFRRCEFYDLCRFVQNPLRWVKKVQPGFKQEWWRPEKSVPKKNLIKLRGLR
jgi:hypothetical protein